MALAQTLLGYAVNGIVFGSILALAAIGLTLVYGILRLSNFAHGDLLTLGAYTAFLFGTLQPGWGQPAALLLAAAFIALVLVDGRRPLGLLPTERRLLVAAGAILAAASVGQGWLPVLGGGFALAILLAVATVPLFNLGLDRIVWRPLRRKKATVVTLIITSIGVALALRNLLAMYFGTDLQTYARPFRPSYVIGGSIIITQTQVATVATAGVLILGVHLLLKYTQVGKSLRAVSDDLELARVAGIDVDRMIAYVWILGGGLTGIGGVLLALNRNVHPELGWQTILPIFAAVVLGGIGSAYGAMLGALIIAVAMELSVAWIPDYRLAVGFAILILVMFIRPQGIMGVKN